MFEHLSRLRKTQILRELFQEVRVSRRDLVVPIFVQENLTEPVPIPSMPNQFRWPLNRLGDLGQQVYDAGIPAVLLFGIPSEKDPYGSSASKGEGVVSQAIQGIKAGSPDLVVMTDICLCSYTDHGHCGIMLADQIDPERTRLTLAKMAVNHAKAGADLVAPSAMTDGQVFAIRQALDSAGFKDTPIMGYSAKFASALYGPFRDAADSAPAFGDRRSYQLDPANANHAQREVMADLAEGADVVMVKPGVLYLDILSKIRGQTDRPIAAYHVSGEYAMIKAAGERGWIDERKVILETLLAFRRAGADLIITYHALEAAPWIP